MDNKKNEKFLIALVSNVDIPEYKETKIGGRSYVNHGANNLYPQYLLDKFKRSPKHGAIIKNKVKYILGKGFEFKEESNNTDKNKAKLKKVNDFGESLTKVGRKCITDFEIHNGFYLQVIWTKGGGVQVAHLDYHKVRSNEDNTLFYFKKDWSKPGKIEEFPAFNPEKKSGTQIYFYKAYTPGADVYTEAEYRQGLAYIEADILVAEHTLNNSKSGFTGSKMITFTDGEPETEEEKDAIEDSLNRKFTGSGGSKLLISFVNDKEKAPIVDDMGASDLTKEDFTRVDKLIEGNIFATHCVTSPALFGIKQEGQLGGSQELRSSYEIFRNTYANSRAEEVEEGFNFVMTAAGFNEVKLIPVSPVGYDLSEISNVAPKAYILKEILGINPDEYPADQPPIDPTQKKPANSKEPVANEGDNKDEVALRMKKDDEVLAVFAEFGRDKAGYIPIKKKKVKLATQAGEDDFLTDGFLAFDFSQTEAKIVEIIRKDARATAQVISEALDLPVKEVNKTLSSLEERGLLTSKTETVGEDEQTVRTLTKEGKGALSDRKEVKNKLRIMYSYDGPKDDRNRPFCARLMELNRYYTRAEIETISERVGYSVWERRGGFYHNPETDKTTPYCRHSWSQEVVVEKSKN
jgi:DNA-binding Lrp family transcriptional regulator